MKAALIAAGSACLIVAALATAVGLADDYMDSTAPSRAAAVGSGTRAAPARSSSAAGTRRATPALPRGSAGGVGASDSSLPGEILRTPELRQECFAAEARDSKWSSAAEPQLLALFSRGARASGVMVDEPTVECRTTLCQLHVSSRAAENQAEAMANRVAWDSLRDEMRKDSAFTAAFDPDAIGLRSEGSTGHTMTFARRLSDEVTEKARCGGLDESALTARVIGPEGLPRSERDQNGLPTLPEGVVGSYFKLNAYFEAEQRDEEWAPAAETQINDFFSTQSLGDAFANPSIECRETLCEVQTSSDMTASPGAAAQVAAWNDAYFAMPQSADLELDAITTHMHSEKDDPDRIVFVAFLLRRR
jgi:hypothetical protein